MRHRQPEMAGQMSELRRVEHLCGRDTGSRIRGENAVRSFVRPQPLSAVREEKFRRIKTASASSTAVLGGGIVPASMVLLGGDPA